MRTRTIVVAAVVSLATVAVVGYGAASAVVYDELSKVSGDCPSGWADNDPTSFNVVDNDGNPLKGHETFDATSYLMPAPEAVTIPSRDPGIELSGWYIPAEEADAPTVVITHGVSACKRDHTVLLPAGMLHRNGFNVLLFDLRDHGDSTLEDGRYSAGTEEYMDTLGAWDWLQVEKGATADRIGLYGSSLGAATTLMATGYEPQVAATFEDSSYADLPSIIRDELTRTGYPTFLDTGATMVARLHGDDLTTESPLNAIRQLDARPIYIVHGNDDARIAVRYGHELVDAATEAGSTPGTWFVNGAEHTHAMLDQPEEYEHRLVEFFRSTLGGTSSSG